MRYCQNFLVLFPHRVIPSNGMNDDLSVQLELPVISYNNSINFNLSLTQSCPFVAYLEFK
jgi:hypothetical protein